jgi:SNF family Na+-dependent transporter
MGSLFLLFLIAAILSPLLLLLLGVIFLFNNDEAKRKRGKYLLLTGILAILVEILIGYSMCSNFRLH